MINTILTKIKSVPGLKTVLAVLALFFLGFLVGRHYVKPRIEQHVVEDVESKKRLTEALKVQTELQQKLVLAQHQIEELKIHQVTHTKIIKKKDGTVIVDKVVKTDSEKKVQNDTHITQNVEKKTAIVDNKTIDLTAKKKIDFTSVSIPETRDNLYVGVFSKLDIHGITKPGLEVKWSPIKHAWIGASLDTSIEFRLAIGFSFSG